MTWRRSLPWLVLFAALAAVGAGLVGPLGGGGDSALPGRRMEGRVTRVVDGDTVRVALAGRAQTVRYIGMDTPETVKRNTPVQCFGKRASAENEHLVAGARVTLRLGVEPRDRYGRLLAYVYRRSDGLFVNAALVRGGFAKLLTIPPNVAHLASCAGWRRARGHPDAGFGGRADASRRPGRAAREQRSRAPARGTLGP